MRNLPMSLQVNNISHSCNRLLFIKHIMGVMMEERRLLEDHGALC